MIESKECIKCKKTKIYTHFHASKGNIGGVHPICKVCKNLYGKTWREQNPRKVQDHNNYHNNKKTLWRHAKKVAA